MARRILLWLLPALIVGLLIADPFLESSFQTNLEHSRSGWRTFDLPKTDWSISDLAIDSQDHIWVAGTRNGVVEFDGQVWRTYGVSWALASDDGRAIAFDDQGRVWVGTDHGLSIFDGTAWRRYTPDNSGLPDDMVWAMAVDAKGRAWLGTDTGLSILDGAAWTTYTPESSGLPCPRVRVIALDTAGRAWIGTDTGGFGDACGLTRFDGTTWTTFTAADSGLLSDDVGVIAFDREGRAWIGHPGGFGTASAGVSIYDGKTWTSFTQANSGLPSNFVRDVAFDKQDRAWIAAGSLSVYDDRGWTTYSDSNSGLASVGAQAVAVDQAGRVWAVAANLDGHATLSVLEDEGSTPLPGSAVDLRAAVFAPDARLFVPSLLLILWLGVLLTWPPVLIALLLVPGLISFTGGGPLVCTCRPVMAVATGLVVTYGGSAGALGGSLIERARQGSGATRAIRWIIILAIVGAVAAFIANAIEWLGCMSAFLYYCP